MTASNTRHLLIIAGAVLLSGCATGPVNTANPSTSDLLFRYDELDAYLEQRRGQLDSIQAELAMVSNSLSALLRELGDESEIVYDLREEDAVSSTEVGQLSYEIDQIEQQALALRSQVTAAQKEKAALEAQRIRTSQETRADAARSAELLADIQAYERQIVVLERSLQRYRETSKRAVLRK